MTEADYGYLFCWAENIAGRQREPCRFEVVRESPPDPPIYCQPLNVTWEHIEATCQPGKDYIKPFRFIFLFGLIWGLGTVAFLQLDPTKYFKRGLGEPSGSAYLFPASECLLGTY